MDQKIKDFPKQVVVQFEINVKTEADIAVNNYATIHIA